MTASEKRGRRQPATQRLVRSLSPGVIVAAIVLVTVVLHVVWLVRFRQGYVTEWDESGYLQFSLSDFDGLHDHGLANYLETVGGRGTFGPLLPSVTALAYPVVGRGILGSLLVLPFFYAGLVAAAFGLARQLVSDSWAAVAAVAVAGMPAITDSARLFHFALPATACMTAALWALVRSNGLRRSRWAAIFGLFVALTLLARTMTVAYIPGIALAAGVQLLVGQAELRARMRNLAIAVGVFLLVAGPWYLRNARSVYDNLLGSGYGEASAPYGRHYPIASWGYWAKELRIDLAHTGLLLAGALLLCFLVALGYLLVRMRRQAGRGLLKARTADVLVLVLVVVEGYLVLTSTRNEGTAFPLPWLPALTILGVTAAASIPARAVRLALASALVVVSVGTVLSKSGWVQPLAKARTVSVPGLGPVMVTDGAGIIQRVVRDAGYDIEPVTQPLPVMHRKWLPLCRDVVGWSMRRAQLRGEPLHLTVGLDDPILSNSRFILAAQLWFHQFLPVDYLRSFTAGDTVASYRRQLLTPRSENALITGVARRPYARITRAKVEAAARSLGFTPVKSFTLPDGRKIWIWWRERGGIS